MSEHEAHRIHRIGWLRAAVLGANDGIVSTASLIIGVAAAGTSHSEIILVGIAGLVAGAMSMAAGEYVSVSSQADTENADIAMEKESLKINYDFELKELAEIYESRGLEPSLASEVATQLMEHDALDAHARDELGIVDHVRARPIQAALSSAAMFTIGAALPLCTAWLANNSYLIECVAFTSLACLASLGAFAAKMGGASMLTGASRVTFWGVSAMSITALAGHLFGVVL